MGDRGNIVVKQHGGDIHLYSHWTGYKLAQDLADALSLEERWDDDPYLTRIIFDKMTEGQHGETTGFGISASREDGDIICLVDVAKQTVTYQDFVFSFRDFMQTYRTRS